MTRSTVAVCTRNRAPLLAGCLASLDSQLFDGDDVEVLVVDNGSTDATPDVLRAWSTGRNGRRWVHEPQVGVSHARNAALAASDRQVVIFVDDDALVPPCWAQAHLAAYDSRLHIGAVGGPVGLVWPAGRPEWVTDSLSQWYSALDLGDAAGRYPNEHGPYGTNMSVWRSAAVAVGGFNPDFGRRGRSLMSGEEPELSRRLVEAGWELHYAPAAAVVQQVLPERIDRKWLLRRGWSQGVTNARLASIRSSSSRAGLLSEARSELTTAVELYRGRERRSQNNFATMVLVMVHTGAAREYTRSAIVGGRTTS